MTVAKNKAELLAMFRPRTKTVLLPNGVDSVNLRALTVEQTDAVRDQLKADKEVAKAAVITAGGDPDAPLPSTYDNFGERLVCMSLVNDAGERLLSDADLAEMKKSANGIVEILIREALVVNGFQKAPAEKNSVTIPTADSATA